MFLIFLTLCYYWVFLDLQCYLCADAIQLNYRTAKVVDLPGIAKLLTKTFEDDIPSWNILQSKIVENKYEKQLRKRMKELVQSPGVHHALVVACTNDTNQIAGFMELGTMPSPLATCNETKGRPERPYLANLAVDKDFRRQKMGSKLVELAILISAQWSMDKDVDAVIYLAVDKENKAAAQFYDNLEFCRVMDETERLSKRAQRKLKRKPRLYFERKLDL
mmetsp:Transcript_26737/g.39546  ORF Transcript_26737/g.39546 Transcript_26737/m.39546 type:complete len:220 (-) Transcript_26737:447-1106(-)